MKRFTLILCLLSAPVRGEDRYHVTLDDAWITGVGRVSVEACFDGPAPDELIRHRRAAEFAFGLRGPDGPIANRGRYGRLDLGSLPDDACVSWTVDLARAADRGDYRLALAVDGAVVTDGDLWFWRDPDRRPIRVTVDLPDGVSFSTPWPRAPGRDLVYEPVPTSAWWTSRLALGRFATRSLPVPDTRLRLTVLGVGRDDAGRVDAYADWIRETARSVAAVTGRFPQHEPQVLVIALGRQREAVPWAHVIRGGGVAAEFFVDGTRPVEALRADWTATHELAHLLLPYVSGRDRWLSEGLASYYQNVLRARDGRLDEHTAWRKLDSGFDRGRRATRGGTLVEATRSGRGATMRVYWSGAALMLIADTELRALSGGAQSLDSALAALHACCHDPARRWRARELFTRLDRLTGYDVFMPLYHRHVLDEAFPDLRTTYERLGLRRGRSGVTLEPDAPWSRIRHFIMNESAANAAAGGGR